MQRMRCGYHPGGLNSASRHRSRSRFVIRLLSRVVVLPGAHSGAGLGGGQAVEVVLPAGADAGSVVFGGEGVAELEGGDSVVLCQLDGYRPYPTACEADIETETAGGSQLRMVAGLGSAPSSMDMVTITVLPGAPSPVQGPIQRAVRSDSVMLAQTSAIGARKVRLMISSRPQELP